MRLPKAARAVLPRKKRPTLVTPVPEVGPRPEQLQQLSIRDQVEISHAYTAEYGQDDNFLWPPPAGHKGLALHPPPHSEWAQRYKEVKDRSVTYDAEQAQTRLLQHISSDHGQPIARFVIAEPIRAEDAVARISTAELNTRHKKGN